MNNFIEIIILFFIIYSILNAIAASNKKKRRETNKYQNNQDESYIPKTEEHESFADFNTTEDLFGINLPRTEENFPSYKSEKEVSLETISWDPEKEFQDKIKLKEVREQESIKNKILDVDYDDIQSLEEIPLRRKVKLENSIYETQQINYSKLFLIKNKLQNPQTMRDIFLISEILNKPKALQR